MFNVDEEEQMVIFRECGCSVRKARGVQQAQLDKLQLIFQSYRNFAILSLPVALHGKLKHLPLSQPVRKGWGWA